MMYNQEIVGKLDLIEPELIIHSENEFIIKETKADGRAELKCKVSNPVISFLKLKDHKLNYFKCKKSADCIIIEENSPNNWIVHVIEFKRTVRQINGKKLRSSLEEQCLTPWL